MVRGFRLLNEKGQEFSMMDIHNYCLLTDPNGLGLSYYTEYEQLGNTFIEILRKIEQKPITAAVNFTKYDNFKKFIDFIEDSDELKLAYKVPYENGEKEYFKDIEIQEISKTQIQPNGIISENITVNWLSLWYEEKTQIYNIQPNSAEDLRWDFRWDKRFSNNDTRDLQFINNGHIEAPVEIELDGRILNPKIELYIEGELYQSVSIRTEIREYEKLLYGTKENDFYINRQKTDGTLESLFDLDIIDFENDNIIRIPKKKSCELKLIADGGNITQGKITIYIYYKAV